VLADGTYLQANCCDSPGTKMATLNPATLTWTPVGTGKFDYFDEEGWTLLPDGSVLTVDAYVGTGTCGKNTERYSPVTGTWTSAGNTPSQLADCANPANNKSFEMGPQVLIPGEAETVRHIFRRYVALGSVRLLQEELETQGVTSKSWTSSSGRHWGGKPIARGALYLLLQNRIYRGEIVHKDQHYPGEHESIIDPELWEAAQAKLAANAVERSTGIGARSPSLLAGLLFDADGNRMTPTHAVKNGRRYRYYVSQPLITGARAGSPNGMRVPAPEIEQLITERIRQLFGDPASLIEATEPFRLQAAAQRNLLRQAAELATIWSTLQPAGSEFC
jgi:hypothetical protein